MNNDECEYSGGFSVLDSSNPIVILCWRFSRCLAGQRCQKCCHETMVAETSTFDILRHVPKRTAACRSRSFDLQNYSLSHFFQPWEFLWQDVAALTKNIQDCSKNTKGKRHHTFQNPWEYLASSHSESRAWRLSFLMKHQTFSVFPRNWTSRWMMVLNKDRAKMWSTKRHGKSCRIHIPAAKGQAVSSPKARYTLAMYNSSICNLTLHCAKRVSTYGAVNWVWGPK